MTVNIERDIIFARARVGYHEPQRPMREVALRLDAYLPDKTDGRSLPALIMAFGGAFHRGSKENDAFSDGTGTSTAVADYCQRFAELGMAAFSVEYRLAQTDPEPGTPLLTQPEHIPMSRVNPVRAELGLPPIAPKVMAGIMEAAFDDVANAVRFIKDRAHDFHVDPQRIVLGGFSAGGRCAMYVAYGKRIGVRGVISLSGPLVPIDGTAFLSHPGDLPPLLMISGEHDLDYVCSFMPNLDRQFRDAMRPVEWAQVTGGTHFYPAVAKVRDGRSVMAVMRDSLLQWECLPRH